ncbi:hypothetical protein DPMN_097513 [Dreissena polymorpha]|uniref:Uncharacterized protein n=1 Tax=Dreissena polymorpha TaxID=45954 RepID=A0A9D4R4T4_DREPO|nr:hypothetical protein DPMN_097513 [Dreissena polymorpha]
MVAKLFFLQGWWSSRSAYSYVSFALGGKATVHVAKPCPTNPLIRGLVRRGVFVALLHISCSVNGLVEHTGQKLTIVSHKMPSQFFHFCRA